MFKDYVEMVWKPSWEWLKKYWLGYTILIILLYTAFLFIFCREYVIDWLTKKLCKLLGFEKEESKERVDERDENGRPIRGRYIHGVMIES